MSDKPNISFGDGAKIDTFQTGENAKVVHGDEVAGDKVGNQVAGDNHGSMEQINVSEGDYNAKCKEAVGNLLTELAGVTESSFAPDAVGDMVPEPSHPLDECHPVALLGDINAMADREEPPTEEEATGLKDRLRTMFERVGEAGKKVLVNLGPLAVAGMEATSFMPPPWNIVCPVVKAAVKQFGPKQAEPSWGGQDYSEPTESW